MFSGNQVLHDVCAAGLAGAVALSLLKFWGETAKRGIFNQWRANSGQNMGRLSCELGKANWGWSWMERWIASCPWENKLPVPSTSPKKVPTKQVSKVVKTASSQAKKVSVKTTLSNGKGYVKVKSVCLSPTKSETINIKQEETLESINENKVVMDNKQNQLANFVPAIRSGEWAQIGSCDYMEDTHVCIADMAKKFGQEYLHREVVSFFGVFDGHSGKDAAHFVRDNLPRVIVEDANFPLELEKVVIRSFAETDAAFARTCSIQSSLS